MSDLPVDPPYLVERFEGVLRLTFNRPDQGNATPGESVPALTALFREVQNDPSVRCILIAGKGRHFAAGGDIGVFAAEIAAGAETVERQFHLRMTRVAELAKAMLDFDRPIIAAVRGGVAGAGLLFTLAADFVIIDDSACFLFAHQRVGLSPDAAVSYLLPRVVGIRQAKRLIMQGAAIRADEAVSLGLATQLVPSNALDATASDLAAALSKAPQLAIRNAKTLLNGACNATVEAQLAHEAEAIIACVKSADFAEGVDALLSKRKPDFPSTW